MVNKTVEQIIGMIFQSNISEFTEEEARKRIIQCITELKEEGNGFDELNYSVFVQDSKKALWQNKSHFFKVFYDEIEYAREKYELTQSEIDFILRLGKYLKWELNLIVNEEGIPLNQKEIAQLLHITTRCLQNYMRSLTEKKMLIPIKYGKENFYLINPFIIFTGQKINNNIPKLFNLIGYTQSALATKSNRRKKASKHSKIND